MENKNPSEHYCLVSFTGKIHLILNDVDLAKAMPGLESAQELGFDTETKPSFKKGETYQVALLQLSTPTDAYLIRLHQVSQFQEIKKIFEDENVKKVGVAIRDDLKQLQKIFSFVPKGFVELQELGKSKGLQNLGLRSMANDLLQVTINKGPKTTNWEASVLTDRQQLYAATDAWIGLEIYKALLSL